MIDICQVGQIGSRSVRSSSCCRVGAVLTYMIYCCRTRFLGWMCTKQILHISQRQVRLGTTVDDLSDDLADDLSNDLSVVPHLSGMRTVENIALKTCRFFSLFAWVPEGFIDESNHRSTSQPNSLLSTDRPSSSACLLPSAFPPPPSPPSFCSVWSDRCDRSVARTVVIVVCRDWSTVVVVCGDWSTVVVVCRDWSTVRPVQHPGDRRCWRSGRQGYVSLRSSCPKRKHPGFKCARSSRVVRKTPWFQMCAQQQSWPVVENIIPGTYYLVVISEPPIFIFTLSTVIVAA